MNTKTNQKATHEQKPISYGELFTLRRATSGLEKGTKVYVSSDIFSPGRTINPLDPTVRLIAPGGSQCWSSNREVLDAVAKSAGTGQIVHYDRSRVNNIADHTIRMDGQIEPQLLAVFAWRPSFVRTVGSDPEVLVVDGNARCIPAFRFLPDKNNKASRKAVEVELPYWDGFQAEFCTRANSCLAYHIDSVQHGLRLLVEATPDNGYISESSVVDVSLKELSDYPGYAEFGCTPSSNAYGRSLPIPDGNEVELRMAGGHIHLGLVNPKTEAIPEIVRTLDKLLGVVSVGLFQGMDDPRRRLYYGRAGEYREPAHGLEYRVLSNAWLCHPIIAHLVFTMARFCVPLGVLGIEPTDITDSEVQEVINSCNVEMALALISRNEKAFRTLVYASVGYSKEKTDAVWEMIHTGVKSKLRAGSSIRTRWKLPGSGEPWLKHSEANDCSITKWSDISILP
jgi:hypothetical protein